MSIVRDFQISVKYAECKAALQRISDVELPEAIAAGINRIAGGAAAAQRINLRERFTLRNKYAEGSLVYYKANPKKDINRINAIVGSKQPFLALQEEGGTRRPVKGSKVPVPTRAARGGNWKAPIMRRYTIRRGALAAKFFILRPGRDPSGLNMRHKLSRVRKDGRANWKYRLTSAAIFKRDSTGLVKVRLLNASVYHLKARHWHSNAVEKYGRPDLMAAAFIAEAKRRLAKYQAS